MKILAVLLTSFVSIAHAEEVKPNTDKTLKTEKKTLTIESKVTGSQEQPKVLYIMPWQGIANPITIKDQKTQLTMPEFKPINPKIFRKQVRDFTTEQANKVTVKDTKNK
jgi:hypothetical protein